MAKYWGKILAVLAPVVLVALPVAGLAAPVAWASSLGANLDTQQNSIETGLAPHEINVKTETTDTDTDIDTEDAVESDADDDAEYDTENDTEADTEYNTETDTEYDTESGADDSVSGGIFAMLGGSAGIAGLIMFLLWRQHNTIRRQLGAEKYVVPGSAHITYANQELVHSYVTSVKISKS